ncbi:MAG: amino acid decarboxylase [Clostridia bacterium]|nr:amino acid decarboxylase [Clostridia bacterium]
METPIYDFVAAYAASDTVRFHMPGHKGIPRLGCESLDITEIAGADALYEADGIIAKSEQNAAALFGTVRTLYSTEGSSQCIRAMLFLAATCKKGSGPARILAGRNAHKAFLYAAALLDLEVEWLWPTAMPSLLGCPLSAAEIEAAILAGPTPVAVYLTDPDYLGGRVDLAAIGEVCHKYGVLLLVDNAHGAYLHFLDTPSHPMDLGADLCCDSAHKTLPVLTGGAYLHLDNPSLCGRAKEAMALFGSTSPSYLTLASLDLCNRYLAEEFRTKLAETVNELTEIRKKLTAQGWVLPQTDPLKLTIRGDGIALSSLLRRQGMEAEYADKDALVLMLTPDLPPETLSRLVEVLSDAVPHTPVDSSIPPWRSSMAVSIREAIFAPRELICASHALGRICAAPTVGCPPAIPIAVSGEKITPAMIELFEAYGVHEVAVLA